MSDGDVFLEFLAREAVSIQAVMGYLAMTVFGSASSGYVYRVTDDRNGRVIYEGESINIAIKTLLGQYK